MNRTIALSRFVLQPAQWDADAEACARKIPFDCPGDYVAWLADEVFAGRSELCRLIADNAHLGFVVFHVAGPEFVVQAVCGFDAAAPFSAEFLPELDRLARLHRCETIRFHTMRRAIINLATSAGYRLSEVIMRKEVLP